MGFDLKKQKSDVCCQPGVRIGNTEKETILVRSVYSVAHQRDPVASAPSISLHTHTHTHFPHKHTYTLTHSTCAPSPSSGIAVLLFVLHFICNQWSRERASTVFLSFFSVQAEINWSILLFLRPSLSHSISSFSQGSGIFNWGRVHLKVHVEM